ncbi:hypothetical protein LRP67_01635 [Nocardioides sp. cx-169]|uniref:hypothetical protein n=1 Tax=Nocardioides sp. cx-169 TaxID=2899080 RepID=UPI001E33B376|nr:hypothetical protein [Nocardioides sp. cx-169]MCD4532787.1 hypothetical protein [Nocardioides sp. cx-169]
MSSEETSQDSVVGAAARETREAPTTQAEALDLADKYDRMMRLADLFDSAGEEMRQRAKLGTDLVNDPAFTESAGLSPATHAQAEEDVRGATTGTHGLLTRSIELDADALVLRATVLTYRWIDELQAAAYQTLGSIAGRAIGYLAPEVALGGAIVSAGLIETDALDRDGVAAYLNELAEKNPELMEHVTSGGGGLLDGLQMRSLLTAGVLSGDEGRLAGRGGLRAMGVTPFPADFGAALRDTAGGLMETAPPVEPLVADAAAPRTLADLMSALENAATSVVVHKVTDGRYIAYLPGPSVGNGRRLRLVGGDRTTYAAQVLLSIESAVQGDPGAHVMLVGSAQGGVTAAEVAARAPSETFVIDQVITAGAPSAHVPRIPEGTRVLSLEDRSDPVAVLGSLMSAGATNRLTVVFDSAGRDGESVYVTGGRAADGASHPELREEISRIQSLGYLAG